MLTHVLFCAGSPLPIAAKGASEGKIRVQNSGRAHHVLVRRLSVAWETPAVRRTGAAGHVRVSWGTKIRLYHN